MSLRTTLYVDLDGSLLRGDSLHESLARLLSRPWHVLSALPALFAGKARFKEAVARRSEPMSSGLPYRQDLLAWLRGQRAAGRRLVLATGADRRIAEGVASELGLFDAVLASDDGVNLTGARKAAAIRRHAAGAPYGYVGNDTVDLLVWEGAQSAVLVGRAAGFAPRLRGVEIEAAFPDKVNRGGDVVRLLRPHQWAKNILVFLPAAAAHRLLDPAVMRSEAGLFTAFSLCASGVYAMNDLVDLPHDRLHAHKKRRPLASGAVTIPLGVVLAAALPAAAFALAWVFAGAGGLAMLLGYWGVTTYYSLHGKRVPLLDVFLLAGLYTFRSFAGALPVPTGLSVWMAAFLLFLFLSLACLKRFSELIALPEGHEGRVSGRGYRRDDHLLMGSLGVGAGFAATLVLCLYVASPGVTVLYSRPLYLMGLAPMVLFGLARFWLQAWRGQMHSDPVVHAMRDRISYLLLLLCAVCMALASYG